MKALILAAGMGTRLRPLTYEVPKPLIKVAREPFLYYVMKNLAEAGFDDLGIIIGYKGEMIGKFLKEYNLSAELIEQKKQLGTGDAIKRAEEWLDEKNFVVVMGDNLYSPRDLSVMKRDDGFCYVAGYRHPDLDPKKFGVLQQEGGLLRKIVEKPRQFVGDDINTGLYSFTPEIFNALGRTTRSEERNEIEITDAINMLCEYGGGRVRVYTLQDYWLNLGLEKDIDVITRFLENAGMA